MIVHRLTIGLLEIFGHLRSWHLAILPFAVYTVYYILRSLYRLYFSPISSIPGPRLAAISHLWVSHHLWQGRYPFVIKELHDKYGPVVRVAPDQISFNTASSWKQIYGNVGGRKQFLKSDIYSSHKEHASIVSERDPIVHGRMRKMLSHAFSAKALSEQEYIIQEYIDKFIVQLDNRCSSPHGEEMVKWYSYLTFDIISDLAFGESFGSVESGLPNGWFTIALESVKASLVISLCRKYPLPTSYLKHFAPRHLLEAREASTEYSRQKILKRMDNPGARKDFMSRALVEKEAQGLSVDEFTSHTRSIVLAGSETTATFLSGVTYYLCRTPRTLSLLTSEIRSAFTKYEDITGHTTESLPYLNACINEGLRIFPPAPFGMWRLSPGETVDGIYIPAGVEVFTHSFAATHSEDNFHKPYEFIPERWLKGHENQDDLNASQPFLLGTRVCLGRNLAMLEMRLSLAKMVWAYDFRLTDDGKLDWMRDCRNWFLWFMPALPVMFVRRPGVVVPPLDA